MSKVSLPTIIFQSWSPFYEDRLIRKRGHRTVGEKAVRAKVKLLEQRWNKWGGKITAELSSVTKLNWLDQDIRVYTVSNSTTSFSHPLTLKIHPSMDYMFDVLTHELIHRLLSNPLHSKKYREARKQFLQTFAKESKVTKQHILLHALHSHIIVKFFGQSRLKWLMAKAKKPDYIRSWQIVGELGYQNIIKTVF